MKRAWGLVVVVATVVVAACGTPPPPAPEAAPTTSTSAAPPAAHATAATAATAAAADAPAATTACNAVVDGPWAHSQSTGDPMAAARTNTLPLLPGRVQPARIVSVTDYATPEDYVGQNAGILRPRERVAAMHQSGFTHGVVVEYAGDEETYDVTVLMFESNAAAVDYARVHLHDVCDEVVASSPLPDGEGLVYVRTDGLAKAVLVSGNAEISICGCFKSPDPGIVATQWATAVYQRTSASTGT